MRNMISAYKVRNADGLFARAGFHGWSAKGKTWSMRNHLTAALSLWKANHRLCDPATGKYCNTGEDGRMIVYDYPIPEDWVIVELTENGLQEYSAAQFYAERKKKK